jgi:hypothetical protein
MILGRYLNRKSQDRELGPENFAAIKMQMIIDPYEMKFPDNGLFWFPSLIDLA